MNTNKETHMKNKMMKSVRCLAATLFAFAFAFAANAGDWFDGDINNNGTSPTGGAWAQELGDSEFAEGVLKVDAADTPLTFTAEEAANVSENMAVVNTTVKFTAFDGEDGISAVALPGTDAKGALIVLGADGTEGSSAAYYGLMQVESANAWVKLTGATPDVDDAVTVTISIKYEDSAAYVQYKAGDTVLKTVDDTSDGFYEFVTEGDFIQGYEVGTVCYKGVGEVTSLVGTQESLNYSFTVAAPPTGVKILKVNGVDYVAGTEYKAAPGSTVTITYEADGAYVLSKTESEFDLTETGLEFDLADDQDLEVEAAAVAAYADSEGEVTAYYLTVAAAVADYDATTYESGMTIKLLAKDDSAVTFESGYYILDFGEDYLFSGTLALGEDWDPDNNDGIEVLSGMFANDPQAVLSEGSIAIKEGQNDYYTVVAGMVYSITYTSEHGTAPEANEDVRIVEDGSYTLTEGDLPTLEETGWVFNGWMLDEDLVVAGETEIKDSVELVASWTEESGPKPIVVDDIEITISDEELAEMGYTGGDKADFLAEMQDNGLARWQNYALGLDGDDWDAQPEVEKVEAEGKLSFSFKAPDDGFKGGVSVVPFVIDLSDILVGTYFNSSAQIALTDNKNTNNVGEAVSVGVHKIRAEKLVLVSVPYGALLDDTLTIHDFIATTGLAEGTQIAKWVGSDYKYWTLTEGEWVQEQEMNSFQGALQAGSDPEVLVPGETIWVIQNVNEPSDVIVYGLEIDPYLIGETTITAGTEAQPTWTLLANPNTEKTVDLNNAIEGAVEGDKISVEDEFGVFEFIYDGGGKDSGWGYFWQKTEEISGHTVIKQEWVQWAEIEPGMSFWYISKGGSPTIDWTKGPQPD